MLATKVIAVFGYMYADLCACMYLHPIPTYVLKAGTKVTWKLLNGWRMSVEDWQSSDSYQQNIDG